MAQVRMRAAASAAEVSKHRDGKWELREAFLADKTKAEAKAEAMMRRADEKLLAAAKSGDEELVRALLAEGPTSIASRICRTTRNSTVRIGDAHAAGPGGSARARQIACDPGEGGLRDHAAQHAPRVRANGT